MNEMIDRVARAIYEAYWPRYLDVVRRPYDAGMYEPIARAAIEAMREPTEAMVSAAGNVSVYGADLHDFVAHQCAAPVWQAMIDAALHNQNAL